MAADIEFIVGQLADEKETWKVEHESVMKSHDDLTALVKKGIALYAMIQLADTSWSQKVQNCQVAFNAEVAKKFHSAYQWWIKPCDQILSQLDDMERTYPVERSAEFRQICVQAQRSASVDFDALLQSMEDSRHGRVVEWGKDADAFIATLYHSPDGDRA